MVIMSKFRLPFSLLFLPFLLRETLATIGTFNLEFCDMNLTTSFETFIFVRFNEPTTAFTSAFVSTLASNVTEAYDLVAGMDCDACKRRISEIELVAPSSLVAIAAGSPDRRRELQLTSTIGADDYTATFKVKIDQTGMCESAFDTTRDITYGIDVTNYTDLCSTFFDGSRCCCESPSAVPPQGISTFQVRLVLQDLIGVKLDDLLELNRPVNDSLCTDGSGLSTVDSSLFLGADFLLDPSEYEDFLAEFIASYNEMCLQNCYPQFMLRAEILENVGTQIVSRKLESEAEHFDDNTGTKPQIKTSDKAVHVNKERHLSSCWGYTSCYHIGISFGCPPNICPRGDDTDFFTRRHLQEFSRTFSATKNSGFESKNPNQAFHLKKTNGVGSTVSLPRKLEESVYNLENCLCASDKDRIPYTFQGPTNTEFVGYLNNKSIVGSNVSFAQISEAQLFETLEDEIVTEVTIPVILATTGIEDPCMQSDVLLSIITTVYNNLAFDSCDPSFRRISGGTLQCDEPGSCTEENIVRATLSLEIVSFGELPENALFGATGRTKKGKLRSNNGGKGKGSERLLEAVNMASCSSKADGFEYPSESLFMANLDSELSQSTVAGIEGLYILSEPQCQCDDQGAEETYEMNGVTFIPMDKKPCKRSGKGKGSSEMVTSEKIISSEMTEESSYISPSDNGSRRKMKMSKRKKKLNGTRRVKEDSVVSIQRKLMVPDESVCGLFACKKGKGSKGLFASEKSSKGKGSFLAP